MKIRFFLISQIVLLFNISLFADDEENKPLSVLIIGGGPAGLATAIEAETLGCTVTIVEKRKEHSRFQPVIIKEYSLKLLKKWNTTIPEMTVFDIPTEHNGEAQAGLVQIRFLEKGLEKKIKELQIKRIQGEFQGFGPDQSALIVIFEKERLQIPYDIIIGADGAHSCVREALAIKKKLFASAVGAWAIIPKLTKELVEPAVSPTIRVDDGFYRIYKDLRGSAVFIQFPLCASKDQIKRSLETQGMIKEARSVEKGYALIFEQFPILLDQVQAFSNEEKSAILIGDSAALSSFLVGNGANTAFKSAEIAGFFLKEIQISRKTAFQNFNQSMKEETDKLIEANSFLFGLDYVAGNSAS